MTTFLMPTAQNAMAGGANAVKNAAGQGLGSGKFRV